MRVADYIGQRVKAMGCPVFYVPGGGSIYLTDGLHCAGVDLVSCHHEQAAAMAAEGYAKTSGRIGVCCVTTGCGGTNALTGILSAYQDSTPVLCLSGQVKRANRIAAAGCGVRQFGVQEADIVSMVHSVTKYAATILDADRIAYDFDFALSVAMRCRRGPVWLDVPLDVQTAEIEPDILKRYEQPGIYGASINGPQIARAREWLGEASRPIVVVGQGVRLAGAVAEFREFVESRQLPVVASWLGLDILPSNHPLNLGPIGRDCDKGNAAVAAADLVLAIGSRLSMATYQYEPEKFAPNAKVIAVDVDPAEHRKPGVKIDLFVPADAGEFLRAMKGDDAAVIRRCW